jgi:hypothetical protein
MYSIGFRSGSKEGGKQVLSNPFGFHPYMLHFMAVQIVQDDNIVNCINCYDSLFLDRREIEMEKFTLTLALSRGLYQIVRNAVF